MNKSNLCVINLCHYFLLNDDDILSVASLYNISLVVLNEAEFVYNNCLPLKVVAYNSLIIDDYEIFVIPKDCPIDQYEFSYELINNILNKQKKIYTFVKINRAKLKTKKQSSLITECFPNFYETNLNYPYFQSKALAIYICGNCVNTSKNNINIILKEKFEKTGAKIISISNNEYAGILGQKIYPKEIFNKKEDLGKRCMKFSNYITDLDNKEHPDLYLMTVPSFTQTKNYNEFMIPDIFKLMSPPDYLIYCLFTHNYTNNEISQMSNLSINTKKVDCYYISQNSLNLLPNRNFQHFSYEIVRHTSDISKMISNNLSKHGITVFADMFDLSEYVLMDFFNKYHTPGNCIL